LSRDIYTPSGFSGHIGVAREDITPPVGIYARNWGAAQHDVATGIHRPLTLTALTLQQTPDGDPLVLIAADLGWWRTLEDEWFVRSGVLEAFSLAPARVMMNLSHTHAGPSICREDADKPGGEMIAPYLEKLREAAIAATRRALESAQSTTLTWMYGRCNLAADRDLCSLETEKVLCGFNPDRSAGGAWLADDTLLVGRVTTEGGATLATLVNYACHPTTLAFENSLISPDFVGAMRELVEAHTGDAPCLFLQGASGELAPRDQYTSDTAIADANGRQLGYSVLAALEGMLPPCTELHFKGVVESGASLAIWKRAPFSPSNALDAVCHQVEMRLKCLPSVAEIEAELAHTTDRVEAEKLRRKRRVRQAVGEGTKTRIPLWIWHVGDSVLIGQPNEAYSLLQHWLRGRFPDNALAVMNVVNGHIGYLPRGTLYLSKFDSYPVTQTPFEQESLEWLMKTLQKRLQYWFGGEEWDV